MPGISRCDNLKVLYALVNDQNKYKNNEMDLERWNILRMMKNK